jgi:hypothetical protein
VHTPPVGEPFDLVQVPAARLGARVAAGHGVTAHALVGHRVEAVLPSDGGFPAHRTQNVTGGPPALRRF